MARPDSGPTLHSVDLSMYFASDRVFYRSPLGGMIDHCRARSADSEGRRIPKAPSWAWLPPPNKDRGEEGVRGVMYVSETPDPYAGSYEVTAERMTNLGSTDRRLREVSRSSPSSYQVLAAYHGDRGARWAAAAVTRRDPKTKDVIYEGVGPGAIAALFAMTPAGRMLLELERAAGAAAARPKEDKGKGKKVKKPRRDETKEFEARRAELIAAVAEKQRQHEAIFQQIAVAANELGALRVDEAQAKDAGNRVPQALRKKIATAERTRDSLRDALADIDRMIDRLRAALAYTAGGSGGWGNPQPDPGFQEEVQVRRDLVAAHEEALVAWRETKADLERVCGEMADNDPRLPTKPPEPELPTLPQARSAVVRHAWKGTELSEDDLLFTALMLADPHRTCSSEEHRRLMARRRFLIQRAGAQAVEMLMGAWADWSKTKRPGGRAGGGKGEDKGGRAPAPPARAARAGRRVVAEVPTPPPPSGPRRMDLEDPPCEERLA